VMLNDHVFPIFSTATGEPTTSYFRMMHKLPAQFLYDTADHNNYANQVATGEAYSNLISAPETHEGQTFKEFHEGMIEFKFLPQYFYLESERDDEFGFFKSNYEFVQFWADNEQFLNKNKASVVAWKQSLSGDNPSGHFLGEEELVESLAMASDFFYSPPHEMCYFNPYTTNIVIGHAKSCKDQDKVVKEKRVMTTLPETNLLHLNELIEEPGLVGKFEASRDQAILMAQNRHEAEVSQLNDRVSAAQKGGKLIAGKEDPIFQDAEDFMNWDMNGKPADYHGMQAISEMHAERDVPQDEIPDEGGMAWEAGGKLLYGDRDKSAVFLNSGSSKTSNELQV